jgi:hypothetical protein
MSDLEATAEAVYEAYRAAHRNLGRLPTMGPWAGADPAERDCFRAAAFGTMKFRIQLKETADAAVANAEEAEDLRAVVAEMIAHWQRTGTTPEEDQLIDDWSERAGLPPS